MSLSSNLHTKNISLSMNYFVITKEVIPAWYKSFFSQCALNFLIKFVVRQYDKQHLVVHSRPSAQAFRSMEMDVYCRISPTSKKLVILRFFLKNGSKKKLLNFFFSGKRKPLNQNRMFFPHHFLKYFVK